MTWILLRGLMRETRHWGDFVSQLQATRGDEAIIAIDLPGNGSLYQQQSPLRVSEMVENCRLQLQQRGINGPVTLVALSLGGMVAADWARHYPQQVKRCVLINTSMRPFSPFYRRLRPGNYPALLGQGLRSQRGEAFERLILRLTSSRGDSRVLADWCHWQQQYPVSRGNALRQLLAAARFRAPKQKPAAHMLVLTGAKDRLVDHRCSLALASAWQTALAIHPWAGHDLPLDDAAWVVVQINQWLKQDQGC